MNVAGPIKALIEANSTANGLLDGRVYAGVLLQQTAFPAAAINITGNTPANTKTGPSDLDRVLVQIDVYSADFAGAAQTSEAIRSAIDYKTDSANGIDCIFYLRTIDAYSERPELFRKISEYAVVIKRSL